MKPLQNKFNTMIESYPELSSLICFYRAVKAVGPNTRTIAEGLQKLVDKKDYSKSDTPKILEWLKTSLISRSHFVSRERKMPQVEIKDPQHV